MVRAVVFCCALFVAGVTCAAAAATSTIRDRTCGISDSSCADPVRDATYGSAALQVQKASSLADAMSKSFGHDLQEENGEGDEGTLNAAVILLETSGAMTDSQADHAPDNHVVGSARTFDDAGEDAGNGNDYEEDQHDDDTAPSTSQLLQNGRRRRRRSEAAHYDSFEDACDACKDDNGDDAVCLAGDCGGKFCWCGEAGCPGFSDCD